MTRATKEPACSTQRGRNGIQPQIGSRRNHITSDLQTCTTTATYVAKTLVQRNRFCSKRPSSFGSVCRSPLDGPCHRCRSCTSAMRGWGRVQQDLRRRCRDMFYDRSEELPVFQSRWCQSTPMMSLRWGSISTTKLGGPCAIYSHPSHPV